MIELLLLYMLELFRHRNASNSGSWGIQRRETDIFFPSVLHKSIKSVTALVRLLIFFFLKIKRKRLWISNWEKSILDRFWTKGKLYTLLHFTILLYAFANGIRSFKHNIQTRLIKKKERKNPLIHILTKYCLLGET